MSTELQALSIGRSEASRWAPWWVYVLVIAPANLAKEQLLSDDAWWLRAALTAAIVMGGIALVTAVYRAGRDVRVP
jgi:hypothetical protein